MNRMTEQERKLVEDLRDELYTVDFFEEWLGRNDNVFANAPAALQAVAASGYYRAVQRMVITQTGES